jgi:ABC-type nitrate/sulfonate/bicarbonate transport system permease component
MRLAQGVSSGADDAHAGPQAAARQRSQPRRLAGQMTTRTSTSAGPTVEAKRWLHSHRQLVVSIVSVLAAIGIWQLTGLFLQPIFISTPSSVFPSLVDLISTGPLPGAFLSSLIEMVIGVVVASVVGIGIGLLMGRIRILERALDPLVAFGNATPSIALLPVMEVWFGFGTTARVAFITVISVWPVLVNTHAGVRAVRGRLADVGKTFGMSGWQQIRYIYLPGSMPFIFVGARIALAVGAVGMILGGQEIGQAGLGGLTSTFGSYSETADLIATILTTTGLAFLLFAGLRQLQARAFPWIAATSAGRKA